MPRSGGGVYTLPAGNPVVPDTLIEASWANTTLSDIAAEMTNSLARSGAGGMTGPLRITDGSAGVPSLAFGTETATGMYRIGTQQIGISVGGVLRMSITTSAITATGGASFSGDGAALTNLNASNLASGTVPSGRMSGAYTGINQIANNLNQVVLQVGTAASGGSFRCMSDDGTSRWLAGLLTTAGAVNWTLFHLPDSRTYLSVTPSGEFTAQGAVGSASTPTFTLRHINEADAALLRVGDVRATPSGNISAIEQINQRADGNQSFQGRFGAAFWRADGTAINSGTAVGMYAFGGVHTGSSSFNASNLLYPASVVGVAEGSFTSASAMPVGISFRTGSAGESLLGANNTYGTERMRISSAGNVTINAPSSGTTLSLTGAAPLFVTDGTRNGGISIDASNVWFGTYTNHGVNFFSNNTVRANISNSGVFTYTPPGSIGTHELGFRNIPRTTSTTIDSDSRGRVHAVSSGITIPTLSAEACVMIYNDSASSITLTQGSGLTLRLAGTTTTGNRTLAPRGYATIWYNSATEAICSGNVT